jgi:hypothetical protein
LSVRVTVGGSDKTAGLLKQYRRQEHEPVPGRAVPHWRWASFLIAFAIAYSYRKMRKKRRILIQKSKKNIVTPPPGTIL